LFELAPTAGMVIGDDMGEHRAQGAGVERLAFPNGDGSGGLVLMSGGDDPFGIGDDPAIIEKMLT